MTLTVEYSEITAKNVKHFKITATTSTHWVTHACTREEYNNFYIRPNQKNSLFPVARPGQFFPKIENSFWKCMHACTMCMRTFARIWAFLHVVNQTSPGEADSSLHEVFVNLTLRCQEHVESAYCCKLVWGRWLKFAALVLVQKQCVIRSFCRNGRLSCLCAICVALCKSAYASAKEEKTASSIVQFECVSLLVRLTCQRSYPTSHSCTLKKKQLESWNNVLVGDRRQKHSFFLCESWTTCSVLYSSAESMILLCAVCNDVSEHTYLVYSSVSVDGKEEKNNPK